MARRSHARGEFSAFAHPDSRTQPMRASSRPFPWVVVVGAGALGLGVFFLVRRAQAAVSGPAMPSIGPQQPVPSPQQQVVPETVLDQEPAPSPRTPAPAPTVTPTRTTSTSSLSPQQVLERRLLGSETARQLFVLQATGYSWGLTNARPDGVWGSNTRTLQNTVQRGVNLAPTSTFTPQSIVYVNMMITRNGGTARLLPMSLSPAVLSALNASARRVWSDARLIQARAA